MSADPTGGRPSQVTVAGWTAMVASALLVLSIFDQMSSLHSIAMREEVQQILATGSGEGLGISLPEALAAIRWALFVAGAAAVAAAILGFFVLRRDKAARVGLTVVTLPVVLSAPFSGGFLAAVVAASTAMLWTRPARDWFAGRPVRQSSGFLGASRQVRDAQDRRDSSATGAQPRPSEPPVFVAPPPGRTGHEHVPGQEPEQAPEQDPGQGSVEGAAGPPPSYGYGDAGGRHADAGWSAPQQGPGAHPAPYGFAPRAAADAGGRPRAVRTACILTWVFAGASLAGALLLLGALVISPQTLVDQATSLPEWQESGLDPDLLLPAMWVWAIVLVVWCTAALVLAWFTWRRSNGARIGLIVSAVLAVLIGVLGFPLSVADVVASAAVIGLLAAQPTRAWFSGGRGPQQRPRPGPW